MEENDFWKLDSNLTSNTTTPTTHFVTEEYPQEALDYYDNQIAFRIFLELYTLTSLLCAAADVFIIYCAAKYRRLRRERSNLILLNWCVGNIFFMLFSPMMYRVIAYTDISYVGYCLLEHLQVVSLVCNVLMMTLMTIYWFLKIHTTTKFEKFSKHINYYISGAYCACLIYAGAAVPSCVSRPFWGLAQLILFLVCAAYFLTSLILDVAHLWKRRRLTQDERNCADVPYWLSHIYYGSFYSFFVVLIMTQVHDGYLAFTIIFCGLMLLVTLTPIYFLIVLYRCDRDFNVFFEHVLSCRCRNYVGDELDDRQVRFNNDES